MKMHIKDIILKDRKTTTYKFALIRAVLEVIQENRALIHEDATHIYLPMGLVVEKWIIYYWVLLSDKESIPQIRGVDKKLGFVDRLEIVEVYYRNNGGLKQVLKDLNCDQIPREISQEFIDLCYAITKILVSNPVLRFGESQKSTGDIFSYDKGAWSKDSIVDRKWLLNNAGELLIIKEYSSSLLDLTRPNEDIQEIIGLWSTFSCEINTKITQEYVSKVLLLDNI